MATCKISLSDITYGPADPEVNKLVALAYSKELLNQGYRRISNAYCRIARIDRDDWLTVLANERRCSIADFYNVDGSGIGDQHRDHYCRCFSKDILVVHPSIIKLMSSY